MYFSGKSLLRLLGINAALRARFLRGNMVAQWINASLQLLSLVILSAFRSAVIQKSTIFAWIGSAEFLKIVGIPIYCLLSPLVIILFAYFTTIALQLLVKNPKSFSKDTQNESKILSKTSTILGVTMEVIIVPLSVIALLHLIQNQSNQLSLRILFLVLSMITFEAFRLNEILFGRRFQLLMGTYFLSAEVYFLTITILSLVLMRKSRLKVHQVAYSMLLWFHMVLSLSFYTQEPLPSEIIAVITLFLTVSVGAWPESKGHTDSTSAETNDTLIYYAQQIINQTRKLTIQEEKEIKLIALNHKGKLGKGRSGQLIQAIYRLNQKITLKNLMRFLKMKTSQNCLEQPQSLVYQTQKYEALVLNGALTTVGLPRVYALQIQAQKQGDNQTQRRVFKLLEGINLARHTPGEEGVNVPSVLACGNKKQEFQAIYSGLVDQYLTFWKTIGEGEVCQSAFESYLKGALDSEERLKVLVSELKSYRSAQMEERMLEFLMSLTKIFDSSADSKKQVRKVSITSEEFESDYIFLKNGIVTSVSCKILSHLDINEKRSLIGEQFLSFLVECSKEEYQKALEQRFSCKSDQTRFSLLFKSGTCQNKYYPTVCYLKLVPDLQEGAQVLISFDNSTELSQRPSFLYCEQLQRIVGVSSNFCNYFDVSSSLSINQEHLTSELMSKQFDKVIEQSLTNWNQCEINLRRLFKGAEETEKTYSVQIQQAGAYLKGDNSYKLIEIKRKGQKQFTQDNTQILINYLQESQQPPLAHANRTISFLSHDERNFCEIRNPMVSHIEEACTRKPHYSTITIRKLVAVLLVALIVTFAIVLVYALQGVEAISSQMKPEMDQEIGRSTQIKTIFLMYFQYYEYYLVTNYPQHVLQAHPYDVAQLESNYYGLANSNTKPVLEYQLQDTKATGSSTVQLQYNSFNVTMPVARISLLDVYSDLEQAIHTNNPAFMVRNQHVLQDILSSYQYHDQGRLQVEFYATFTHILVILFVFLALMIAIKLLVLRLHSLNMLIQGIYSRLTRHNVNTCIKKISKLRQVLIKSDYYFGDSTTVQTKAQKLPQPKVNDPNKDKSKRSKHEIPETQSKEASACNEHTSRHSVNCFVAKIKSKKSLVLIKKPSFLQLVSKNNLLYIIILIIALYFGGLYIELSTYKTQWTQIMDFYTRVQGAFMNINQVGQTFMQEAMEEILPQSQKTPKVYNSSQGLPNIDPSNLPDFFDEFKLKQKDLLEISMCREQHVMATAPLYAPLNCSLIMHKALTRGFSETFIMLQETLRTYVNTPLADIGLQRRPGGTYPVFIEIFYSRHMMGELLTTTDNWFIEEVSRYYSAKQDQIHNYLIVGMIIFPLMLVLAGLQVRRVARLCRMGRLSFMVLPRQLVLHISTAKQIKREKVLDCIEWMS